jgi:hypothetical protein
VWVIQDSKFGNNQAMKPNEPNFLVDPGYYTENVVYLRGNWIWERERMGFYSKDKEKNPAIIMKYNSPKRVHGIIGTSDGKTGRMEVKMDGNYLTKEQLGKDMKIKDDISFADLEWSFMHNLLKTEKPEIHEIQIIPRSDNFIFYTFVFG